MRHHSTNRKFNRVRTQRSALLASLVEALVLKEKVVTTEAKAKELRKVVEPLITKGKTPTLAVRRALIASLKGRERIAKKIIDTISPRYKDRAGGYTRVTKVFMKSSDARKMALIEFV
ncbi:MAG: 50S ribosomal protein L17 [Candidatus Pacebacteria bacterium]|jgi:large subunit ribosomal protein L17|nr:50S ribosomal protein L17 [Candidatus Paceibacterota bacterium]